jgi:cytochrome c oxidase subunit 2
VEITGKQWWWDVRYLRGTRVIAITANEIYLPAGQTVALKLKSHDVIHSFWVPELAGKLDLIPGVTNQMTLQADRPGIWRGRCAEYCGAQHAHMELEVIAKHPSDFQQWLDWHGQIAIEPNEALAVAGKNSFVQGPCAMCHSIRGTRAGGTAGPDLTHLASRRRLAAGSIPHTPGDLARWIVNTQAIKPGNHMPRLNLAPQERDALVQYLEGLR